MREKETFVGLNPKCVERLKEFCLFDDTFFNVVFKENLNAMELVLQIILECQDIRIKSLCVQEEIRNFSGRSVRFDAVVVDKTARVMNVEIQRRDEGAKLQRARFHSSVLDVNALEKGREYTELPETYVIFITEHDVLGAGLPLYHIDRMITETGQPAGDGAHIIYVNGAYRDETHPIGRLMHDFLCKQATEMYYELLASSVEYFKECKEGTDKMCRIMEELMAESKAEGKAEGTTLLNKLIVALTEQNRTDDLIRSTQDAAFQHKLMEEFGLV